MKSVISIKADEAMIEALKRMASANLSSMSTEVRQAIDSHLKSRGIQWRKSAIYEALNDGARVKKA